MEIDSGIMPDEFGARLVMVLQEVDVRSLHETLKAVDGRQFTNFLETVYLIEGSVNPKVRQSSAISVPDLFGG